MHFDTKHGYSLQLILNEMDPVNQMNFYSYLADVEKPGSPIHPTLPLLMSMYLQRKITVVCGKNRWDSDQSTSSADIVIAFFSRTYMVTKVGKYLLINPNNIKKIEYHLDM